MVTASPPNNQKSTIIQATYGTFTLDMLPLVTVDVTKKIEGYVQGTTVTIVKEFNFGGLSDEVNVKGKKYLQITTGAKTYNIAEDLYTDDIVIDFATPANKIQIVYYIYTNPNANWGAIVSGQLWHLKSYGILSEADLYIHLTDCYNLQAEVIELIKKITPEAIINTSSINQFEYPGIKLAHDLAFGNPYNTIIYFHSKGMSYNSHSRFIEEITLLTKTFENWRKTIQQLNKPGMNKAGLFFDVKGWVWFNFWYAKGTYLVNCEPPVITENRYSYEDWLGLSSKNRSSNDEDCVYILKNDNLSKPTSPFEARRELNAYTIDTLPYMSERQKLLNKKFVLIKHWIIKLAEFRKSFFK